MTRPAAHRSPTQDIPMHLLIEPTHTDTTRPLDRIGRGMGSPFAATLSFLGAGLGSIMGMALPSRARDGDFPDVTIQPTPEERDALQSIADLGPIHQAVTYPAVMAGEKAVANFVGLHGGFVLPDAMFSELVKAGWVTRSGALTPAGRQVLADPASADQAGA